MATMVQVDELSDIGERREGRLAYGVVEAETTVKQHYNRALPHRRAVRDEAGSVQVEEKPSAVDRDVYRYPSSHAIKFK